MASGLLGAAMAQPIDDCLKTLGNLMIAAHMQAPVMTSSWQPLDLLGKSSGGEAKDVLAAILGVMGLSAAEVNDSDTLSRLGIDSMQLVEVEYLQSSSFVLALVLSVTGRMLIVDPLIHSSLFISHY